MDQHGREGATWSAITPALYFFSPAVAVAAAAAAESDSILLDPPFKTYDPGPLMGVEAQGTTSKENLVGSQKRKARKNKIIHLVRTADGTVSLVEGEEAPGECLRPYLHFIISQTCWGCRTRLNWLLAGDVTCVKVYFFIASVFLSFSLGG